MLKILRVILIVLIFGTAGCSGKNSGDIKAVMETVKNYCEGWHTGDGDRMARSVHPNLAKRMVSSPEQNSVLNEMNRDQLVSTTKTGIGKSGSKYFEIKILDIEDNIASVKIKGRFIDYLHLAKFNNEWVIINVLWENYTNKL